MAQSPAGSSADSVRASGVPGAATSNLIFFCDQCGFRVPTADLSSRKARLVDEVHATCVNCSKKRSGATSAQRPADPSSRRSTRHLPIPAPSEPRPSQRGLAPATHGQPSGEHEEHVPVPEKKRIPVLPVALGFAVLVVIGVGVLLATRSGPDVKARTDGDKPVKAKTATTPVVATAQPAGAANTTQTPASAGTEPASKTGSASPGTGEPKTTSSTEEYDPRAAVAASVLAEAKAQVGSNPEDQLEFKSRLERIRDGYARTPAAAEAEKLLGEMKNLPQLQDQLETIPEAEGYVLVYDLDLSRLGWSVNYAVDRRAEVTQAFDRVAYFVELKPNNGKKQWVFVSMDAFTDDVAKIGVPTKTSGAHFQQKVANLNVASNVEGIVTGTGLSTGNIEFWANNYAPKNVAEVPGADSGRYDCGDEPQGRNSGDGYGSMQVHNYEAKQTIFAINHWKEGPNADLGIGNRTRDHPDWTFSGSSRDYRSKRLRVFVHLK